MTQVNPNFKAIETKNATNLKKIDNGGSVPYLFSMLGGKALLLIGTGHDVAVSRAVSAAQHHQGVITIKKGNLTGPGELTVTGCANRRSEFETAVARFSKKKVIFR